MKRYTSAAGLAIRLTLCHVLGLFIVVAGFQWVLFRLSMNAPVLSRSVEELLDSYPGFMGRIGLFALMLVLTTAVSGDKRSRIDYTLRRLSLSDGEVSAIWSGLFAGYFLLYWAMEIGLEFGMCARYGALYGGGENLLFVAAMRSRFFHYLMPMYEPWGFVRNVVICFTFGCFASQDARMHRNGQKSFTPVLFAGVLWWVLTPYEVASRGQDIAVSVILILAAIWQWKRAGEVEDR